MTQQDYTACKNQREKDMLVKRNYNCANTRKKNPKAKHSTEHNTDKSQAEASLNRTELSGTMVESLPELCPEGSGLKWLI